MFKWVIFGAALILFSLSFLRTNIHVPNQKTCNAMPATHEAALNPTQQRAVAEWQARNDTLNEIRKTLGISEPKPLAQTKQDAKGQVQVQKEAIKNGTTKAIPEYMMQGTAEERADAAIQTDQRIAAETDPTANQLRIDAANRDARFDTSTVSGAIGDRVLRMIKLLTDLIDGDIIPDKDINYTTDMEQGDMDIPKPNAGSCGGRNIPTLKT